MFKILRTMLATMLVFGTLTVSLNAQVVTPVSPADADIGLADVSDIVANTENYLLNTVTIEGNIIELVNVKAFVLDDGALLSTNQVLVINNTGRELPVWVSADQRIRVTGIIHPRAVNGGLTDLISLNTITPVVVDPMVTNEEGVIMTPDNTAIVTPLPGDGLGVTPIAPIVDTTMIDPMTGVYVVNPLSVEVVPERLEDWVILELVAIEDLLYVLE